VCYTVIGVPWLAIFLDGPGVVPKVSGRPFGNAGSRPGRKAGGGVAHTNNCNSNSNSNEVTLITFFLRNSFSKVEGSSLVPGHELFFAWESRKRRV
jgi:hypothetical protein